VDPDTYIFIIDLQDANKKLIKKSFFAYYFLKVLSHHFSKIKKKSQNSKNQGFSYYCCLMIEGYGSIPLTNDPGSPKTCGSGGSGSATLLFSMFAIKDKISREGCG
jgi:hypothetical protein